MLAPTGASRFPQKKHEVGGAIAGGLMQQQHVAPRPAVRRIQAESGRRTFPRPLMRLMQKVSSSLLSNSARTQCLGGCRYRPHPLHHRMVTCRRPPTASADSHTNNKVSAGCQRTTSKVRTCISARCKLRRTCLCAANLKHPRTLPLPLPCPK